MSLSTSHTLNFALSFSPEQSRASTQQQQAAASSSKQQQALQQQARQQQALMQHALQQVAAPPPANCTRSHCPKEQQPLPPNLHHFARVQRIAQLNF